jgi:flagellar biosynthesis protein FlhG
MRDFYAASSPVPLVDQAQGLRRLFAGRVGHLRQVIAVAANPHVPFTALALDRLAAALSQLGRQVLVVDAAASAPAAHEFSRLDLAAGLEPTKPGVAYLPARGLPMLYVDTRGSAARFVEALFDAVPGADALLLHAETAELARMLVRRVARPLLLAADHPESLKHAYASCKLLQQRTGLATFDLVLVAAAGSPRLPAIVQSLRGVAERFIGALVAHSVLVDPAAPGPHDDGDESLHTLLAAQLALDEAEAFAAELPPSPAEPHHERGPRLPTPRG